MRIWLFIGCLAVTIPAFAGQVVDLGKFQIEGKMRGPNLQVIEANRLPKDSARAIWNWEMQRLEKELTHPKNPGEKPASTGEPR